MELYGDESGHLRSLLSGEEDLFVLAVVAGDRECCMRCPKRAIRSVKNIEEARWSDMTDVQRRRFINCFNECESDLSWGYVAIKQSDLLSLQSHYRLYEDDLQYAWDLCVIGDCYAELIREVVSNASGLTFTFDRLFSKKMSDRVADMIQETAPDVNVKHGNSRQVVGIQTADFLAGAVRDHLLDDRMWLNQFQDTTCATDFALAGVERRLYDQETGP